MAVKGVNRGGYGGSQGVWESRFLSRIAPGDAGRREWDRGLGQS